MNPDESYSRHSKTYEDIHLDESLVERQATFLDCRTVDDWRELRFLSCLDPLLESFPHSRWLTVADGCFGSAARYIIKQGAFALPTDIDLTALAVAKKRSWINSYQYANAEHLPFDDGGFDFCFCKEAYHHFPRPALAFYEMCRVSRKGFILSEPNDWMPTPLLKKCISLVKRSLLALFGLKPNHPDTGCYEPIGNYVFTLSKREVVKMSIALGYRFVAYRRIADYWCHEYDTASVHSAFKQRLLLRLFFARLLYLFRISGLNRLQVIVLKEVPACELVESLCRAGFRVEFLPVNPYA